MGSPRRVSLTWPSTSSTRQASRRSGGCESRTTLGLLVPVVQQLSTGQMRSPRRTLEPVPRACIGAWRWCHRDGSCSPAHSEGKDLERCCPMALQGCRLSPGGDPKNSCTELWCQHHPLTHSIEGQARQGGGEERELGDQW